MPVYAKYLIENWIYFGFELLVEQNKPIECFILRFVKSQQAFFTFVWHFKDNTIKQLIVKMIDIIKKEGLEPKTF